MIALITMLLFFSLSSIAYADNIVSITQIGDDLDVNISQIGENLSLIHISEPTRQAEIS